MQHATTDECIGVRARPNWSDDSGIWRPATEADETGPASPLGAETALSSEVSSPSVSSCSTVDANLQFNLDLEADSETWEEAPPPLLEPPEQGLVLQSSLPLDIAPLDGVFENVDLVETLSQFPCSSICQKFDHNLGKGPGAGDPALQTRLPYGKGAPASAWGNYRPFTVPGLPLPRPAGKSRGPGLPVTEAVTATRRYASEHDAILHLVDIADLESDRLVRAIAVIADVAEGGPLWAHMAPHYNPTREWSGLLDILGLDTENRRTLQLMAASGRAGQAEANRLVATWAKPQGSNWQPYREPAMVYQRGIADANQSLSQGNGPKSNSAWFPSGAREQPGGAWAAMKHYEPIWARPNAASLWETGVIKDAQDKPLGWKIPDPRMPQFPYWKPRWGMRGGARAHDATAGE